MKKSLQLVFISVFSARFALADHKDGHVGDQPVETASGATDFIGLKNPLEGGGVDSIPTLVEKILEIVLTIGIPIIAVMIIYSGFLFIKARGNPGDLETAKKNLLHVLIGAAILLGAYVIAETVVNTINAIRGV